MTIPKSYEALAADLAYEKIISKTLLGQKEAYMMLADKGRLDLSESKAREAALREELESRPDVSIKNCIFEGQNANGSQAFEFETLEGGLKKLTKINLDGWVCYGPSGESAVASLQQRLTDAEQRAEHWRSVASEATCRAAGLNEQVDDLSALLESIKTQILEHQERGSYFATIMVLNTLPEISQLLREIKP